MAMYVALSSLSVSYAYTTFIGSRSISCRRSSRRLAVGTRSNSDLDTLALERARSHLRAACFYVSTPCSRFIIFHGYWSLENEEFKER
jgi:hypothetical protein